MPPQSDIKIRMPTALKNRLKILAAENGRSMNAEILSRIEQSFDLSDSGRGKAAALLSEALKILEKG